MLGVSAGNLDFCIAKCISHIKPMKILEYGCGQGKFANILKQISFSPDSLVAVQKLFNENDYDTLKSIGYSEIIDQDISSFLANGIGCQYDMIVALDVIEHFMFSDAISIIDYSLYCCKYFLIVWPSRYPQETGISFDTHRTSFELKDLTNRFDIIYYSQTGFSDVCVNYRYHIALIRGHMNFNTMNPALA